MNLETLETRLHFLIKHPPLNNNHNQQYQQQGNNTSVAIGTMIPTPGVSQSGNANMNLPSSMERSFVAGNGGNTMFSAVNSGNFIPNTNGPSGGMHGGYFASSDGTYIS